MSFATCRASITNRATPKKLPSPLIKSQTAPPPRRAKPKNIAVKGAKVTKTKKSTARKVKVESLEEEVINDESHGEMMEEV